MAEYIWVRDSSGHHIPVRSDVPEGHPRGIQPGQQVLEQSAYTASGELRKPTYNVPLGDAPAPSAAITARPRKKRKAAPEPVTPATDEQAEAITSGQQADTERQN